MNRKSSQSGQAILEYILMLMILLFLTMGFLFQFNDAFKIFAQKMFVGEDSFLFCIIREGVVPGDPNSPCPKPKFSLADGKIKLDIDNVGNVPPGPPVTISPPIKVPPPTRVGKSGPPGDIAGSNSKFGDGKGRSSGAGGGGTVATNSADSNKFKGQGDFSSGSSGKYGSGSGAGKGGNGDGLIYDDASIPSNVRKKKEAGRPAFVPLNKEEDLPEASKKSSSIPANDAEIQQARTVAAEKAKKQQMEDEAVKGIDWGNILRYLIIGALLFAIIFFVGSQLVASSRGSRRS